jgi:hypothetical protein
LTCCGQHNLLRDVDGLSEGWKNGVPSPWELHQGCFDVSDIPECIRKLLDPHGTNASSVCRFDGSSFGGYGTTYCESERDHDDKIKDASADYNCTPVVLDGRDTNLNEISLKAFRPLLIKHFKKQFHDNKVVWPERLVNRPRKVSPCISL